MPRRPLSEAEHRENGSYEKNKHQETAVNLQDLDTKFNGRLLPLRARSTWNNLISQLSEDTLTSADTALLVEYCKLTLIMKDAYKIWEKDPTNNQAMKAYTTAFDRLIKISSLFGMNPLSRRQMRIKPEKKKKSPLDVLRARFVDEKTG
jgi:P27 family predicted phage terminase small subunit